MEGYLSIYLAMVLPWYALVIHPTNTIYIKIYLSSKVTSFIDGFCSSFGSWLAMPSLLRRRTFSYSLTAFFTSTVRTWLRPVPAFPTLLSEVIRTQRLSCSLRKSGRIFLLTLPQVCMKRKVLSFLLSTSGTKNFIPVDKKKPLLRAEIALSDEKA